MKLITIFNPLLLVFIPLQTIYAHQGAFQKRQTVITNASDARAVNAVILAEDKNNNLAVADLSDTELNKLSYFNHQNGKCAGFEKLSDTESQKPGLVLQKLTTTQNDFANLNFRIFSKLQFNESYQKLSEQANPENLKNWITFFSSYPDRYNKSAQPNRHVDDLVNKLNENLKDAPWAFSIEKINHNSTKQKTIKLTIKGSKSPAEVVVLGAHFDSINQSFFGQTGLAPGADDNASGSANLLEAVRILKQWKQFDRTIEFYWYAGEESGLLGSAEIAQQAKNENKQVIAVMQLDMTLFPGSGEQVIGSVTDFTSPWLRSLFSDMNDLYVKARLITDQCGYGCSDHASWFRQGYHTVLPFEANTQTMNKNIHSAKDLLDQKSSLNHSNSFTKYAILFSLILGNSDLKPE